MKDHNNQLRLERIRQTVANPIPSNNITDEPDTRDDTLLNNE